MPCYDDSNIPQIFGPQLDVVYALCEWRLEDSAYVQDQIRRAVRLAQDELHQSQKGSLVPVVHLLQLFSTILALQQQTIWLTAEHAAHLVLPFRWKSQGDM